ncbi:MAG: hypothetical protein ACK6DP_05105 [Gemmatimonas sp.]|jgi:hypothetical protein|uniref:hypothetical protein n=1 Tax=Gemmatimonas sp. TaxID=1962908 RepID=UPI00391F752E
MLDRPSIVCRVLRPFLAPIVARPNEVLTAWPGHPTLALCVLTPDGETIIRSRYLPEGVLYSALLDLFLDGSVRLSEESERALLSRPA